MTPELDRFCCDLVGKPPYEFDLIITDESSEYTHEIHNKLMANLPKLNALRGPDCDPDKKSWVDYYVETRQKFIILDR